eukprot:GHVS01030323.1.p1 GENE.GHVS01030323.1~~GHVS01030323.1.p1  ORF type:complete len:249 (-),score=49.66 GHVS01030323.1:524-1270(-)
MCSRGIWQLQQVTINYSETGHSSRGLRFFFRHLLDDWKKRNPQVTLRTTHNQYVEPFALFRFADGSSHREEFKQLTARQVEDVLALYRNSHSANLYLKHGGPKVYTTNRSIQGMWQPCMEGQLKALKWFYRKKPPMQLPKYSHGSLRLSFQVIAGDGRWGSEKEFPKGWDQFVLKRTFKKPFDDETTTTTTAEASAAAEGRPPPPPPPRHEVGPVDVLCSSETVANKASTRGSETDANKASSRGTASC